MKMDYTLVAWNPKGRADRLRNCEDVTRLYAEALCRRISRRVIRDCQARKDCLLSGDDSVLGNLWDEVCVQVQFRVSVYWDVYPAAANWSNRRIESYLARQSEADDSSG